MHRAQKASSKLCHDREVEKAQELHKRKIEGVKSYLTAITRPPAPTVPASSKKSTSSTFFRRSLRQHAAIPNATHPGTNPVEGSSCSVPKAGSAVELTDADSDDGGGGGSSDDGGSEASSLGGDGDANDEVATKSFGKLDELRSVLVPVMAYKGHKTDSTDLDYEQYLDAITNPPPSVHEPPKPEPIHQSAHSLRASAFRMRRLKQIENDNLTIFERIKNSTAHYRTDSLKKDWDQNVAYLTSICAFPVVEEALHAPARRSTYTRKRSPFASRLPDQLPSLQLDSPPIIHPIKAIPTSPKKANTLNLSPAFRSLRKGLPQAPALPPLTASPRPANATKVKSMTAVASTRSVIHFDEASKESSSPDRRRSPSPPLRTEATCVDAVSDDPSRYTLLKIGRFVGGKYLILTVFCGDGITNPYGFDVIALDPEVHVEFHLSITKETTHLLLETISSSSMAERTAAAAGTNLSMELIARCICDHIRYARIGSSEVVFLVATVGNPGGLSGDTGGGSSEELLHLNSQLSASDNASLLLDTMYSAMTFCFHQYVRIHPSTISEAENIDYAHVFASTRPQQCCRSSMRGAIANPTTPEVPARLGGGFYNGLLCFEVCEDCEANPPRPPVAQLQISVNEVIRRFEDEQIALDAATQERLSLDRFVLMSLQFLHLLRPPDGNPDLQLVLKLTQPNEWMCPVQSPSRSPCRPPSTVLSSSLEIRDHLLHAKPRDHLLHAKPRRILPSDFGHMHPTPSRLSAHDEVKNVLQTGMLWRGVYLFARVALLSPGVLDERSGLIVREPLDEMLVFNILNTSTGNYAERILHGDQVEMLSQKLGAWQATVGVVAPLVVFAKLLLLRMRLDVDLRGQEIIVFPTLEPRYHNTGGGSSPVASSRRNSPAKKALASEEGEETATRPVTYSLDSELQEQHKAARSIQALARRFLRRCRHRAAFPGSSMSGSALDESLPHMILAFMRNRAAKRIQFATRNYKAHAVRRRQAHDLNGVKVSTPRALTPTATKTTRSSSNASAHVPLNALHVDENAATPAFSHDTILVDDKTVDSDDTDDDDNHDRSKHVDVLDILPEDEQEDEDEDNKSDEQIAQQEDNDRNVTEEATVSHGDRGVQLSVRTGKKANERFVLERHSTHQTSESQLGTQEHRIIGALGQLDSDN